MKKRNLNPSLHLLGGRALSRNMATLLCAGALGAVGQSAFAVNAAWDIDAASGNFNTAQWTSGTTTPVAGGTYTVLSGDALFFGTQTTGATALTNDLTGATFNGLTFNSGASAFTIGGNSFTLGGNVTNNSSSLQTINNAMTFTSRTFVGGTGGLTLGGTLTSSSSLLTTTGAITIKGAATSDGAAVANAGFVTIGNNPGAGTTPSVTLSNGGSLNVNGTTNATKPNSIIGQLSGTASLNVGATDQSTSGTLTVGANTGWVLGNSNGSGNLNVYSGIATINRGTLATTTNGTDTRLIMMGRDSASSTGTVNLNGGTLATDRQFVRDGSSGAGSGTANFVFNGGTLKALATQTDWLQSTTATIAGQNIGAGSGTLNTNALALSNVTVTAASTIDSNGFSVAINNAISGAGGFTVISSSGSGTVTFGGASTYTGATAVNSGTLALASTGSIVNSSSLSINAGAILNTTAKSTFTLLSAQPIAFTVNAAGGGSAGQLIAAGLDITNGAVSFSTVGTLDDASYVIATYTGLTGAAFSSVTSLPSGYVLNYNFGGTNNTIALVAVPEPQTYGIVFGTFCLVALAARRRARQQA